MTSTRSALAQITANLDESIGLRSEDAAPTLSPVASPKDVGRKGLRNVGQVDIGLVEPDPDQPRTVFSAEAIERLAKSIADKGQLAPIHVRWSEEHSKWLIISGERRWRACRAAGLEFINCHFHEQPLPESEILEQQLIENLLREDLSPMEEARGFSNLMELNGWNGKQVAEALRITPSRVSRALALLKLPEDVQQQVNDGVIPARTAYELSKVKSETAQADLAAQAVEGTLSTARAAGAARKRRGKPATKKGVRLTFTSESGWSVVVSRRGPGSYDEVEQALEEVLEEVRLRRRNRVHLL